jgi:DNA polymerase-4/DNA polymerase V
MPPKPFTLESFPRAILHVDADAFYTSVEQVLHPELKGLPLVTGKERGIISCASYEAKALGIERGLMLSEARRICPSLVILPSDYETYSIFSKRMFNIMRRFTPVVEEYSVDEGFADLTSMQRVHRASYKEQAEAIRTAIHRELGITASAGLSLTRTLAKLASPRRKPDGFTPVAGYHVHVLLLRTPVEKVWGIGPNAAQLLHLRGIRTAYDFVSRSERFAERVLNKPGRDLWRELRGDMVVEVTADRARPPLSISKCKTFGAPSRDRAYVRARVARNLESAFIKLRRHRMKAGTITVALRRSDFTQWGCEARLNRRTSLVQEALPLAMRLFDKVFMRGEAYRTAVVVLGDLEESGGGEQLDLFEDRLAIERLERVAWVVDEVNRRHGKHTLSLGPSLGLQRHPVTVRDEKPWRRMHLLPGETKRRRLGIPRLAIKV